MSVLYEVTFIIIAIATTTKANVLSNSFQREWSTEIGVSSIELEHLSSSNYPSFAYLKQTPAELYVRRINDKDVNKNKTKIPKLVCSLQLNDTKNSIYSLEDLMSVYPEDLEIVVLRDDSFVVVVVDMSNCKVKMWEVGKADSDAGLFLVWRDKEGLVDAFYCSEKRIFRMTYDLGNRNMSEKEVFGDEIFKTDNDFEIASIGSSSSLSSGYYFLSKKGNLLSVDCHGKVLHSLKIYDGIATLQPWEFDYSHGYFGHCYVDMNDSQRVRCLQTDSDLKLLINSTYDFTDIAQNLAIHNSPNGGLWLLVRYCFERCLKYKTHLTRVNPDRRQPDLGKHVRLTDQNQNNDNCDDYSTRSVGFFESSSNTSQICLIGRCYVSPEDYRDLDRHYVYVKCL